ncbi:LOW QUALITY PROTEIN: uncharacterized protein LOC114961879 [Acropora millepora]|uniref:LOW QUALITY PROTEIN: uncharacterized protein LOC114961879 n=1 Tax=Acropora millepora TaxID=45264 RepID=UPI001CF307E0|nr:LOW QUALITY PROTEIN: uncharacterized protein LOC114961879 [Acropora millepora]
MIDWHRINIPQMSREAKSNLAFKLRFDEHQANCYNMAVVNVSLIIISILLSSAWANPTCNETQCEILPIGEDVVVKFQEMAAEKGVRIIYLNTEMGNDSYHPLESNERFFADRWVWANTISEPMLSLMEEEDDYIVHSLGLMEYQVRYLKVPLRDQPHGCLARLSTTCQNNVVGKTLLAKFTKVSSDKRLFKAVPADCVCTLHITDSTKLQHVCCSLKNSTEQNNARLHCEQRAQNTWLTWLQILMGFGVFLQPVLAIFSAALPLLLPSWVFNLQYEYEKDKSIAMQINDSQENDAYQSEDSKTDMTGEEVTGDRNLQRDTHNNRNDEEQMSENQSPDQHHGFEQGDDPHETRNEHQSVDSQERKDRIISLIRPWAFIKTYGKGLTQEEQPGELVNPYGEPLTVIRKDQEARNREIPLDDTSPVTFGGLLSDFVKELPDFNINFNLKMLFLCFGVLPSFLYLKLTLIMSLRMESYREFNRRFTNCSKQAIQETIFCSAIVGSNWQETIMTVTNIYQILGCATLFITLLYVRPKHLFHSYDSRGCLVPNCPSVSLGHEIIIHLNVLQHWAYDLMFFTLWKYMDRLKRCIMRCVLSKTTLNRRNRGFISLCSFFSFLIGLLLGTALGAICIVTFIVTLLFLLFILSPAGTLYFFLVVKTRGIIRSCVSNNQDFFLTIACVIFFSFLFMATLFFIMFTLSISVAFIVKTFLFTVMGLVLNAEVITPYVAFILIVTRNLHLCYSNLQTRYKEVKGMIAEHWKENIRELPWLDKGHAQTIPKDLFWFVCGNGKSDFQKNILPLRVEICFMLRDMALTLTFLSVSLFAILAFKSMNDVSALVSTTFVFLSGVIPTLIFQGFTKKEKFSGWNKIKIEKKIKEAVKEYITKQKDDSLGRDRSFHWFFRYDSDY